MESKLDELQEAQRVREKADFWAQEWAESWTTYKIGAQAELDNLINSEKEVDNNSQLPKTPIK